MKYCVVILDGAAGWPLDELGDRTSLQVARTPNLDGLAVRGSVGTARTIPRGEEPSSAAACTSILGYDPVADRVGRGAIEAASMGIELAADEIALRMNLVTIEDGVMRSYSSGHITSEESRAIVEDLDAAVGDGRVRLYPGVAYRHIMVVRGMPDLLQARYTPPHDISDRPIDGHAPAGARTEFLRDLAERVRPLLASHPVNARRAADGLMPATDIWTFWPGSRPAGLEPFSAKRGITAALTSGVDLLNGLAVLAGITRLTIEGVTDGPDTDYSAQADGALAALDHYDLVVVHVESPDEAGHAGDVRGKIEAIEAIDREIVSRLAERSQSEDLRILAMPDHPTPVAIKTHVDDPVPFVLAGPGVAHNGASRFDERCAAETGLMIDPGSGVMDMLLGSG